MSERADPQSWSDQASVVAFCAAVFIPVATRSLSDMSRAPTANWIPLGGFDALRARGVPLRVIAGGFRVARPKGERSRAPSCRAIRFDGISDSSSRSRARPARVSLRIDRLRPAAHVRPSARSSTGAVPVWIGSSVRRLRSLELVRVFQGFVGLVQLGIGLLILRGYRKAGVSGSTQAHVRLAQANQMIDLALDLAGGALRPQLPKRDARSARCGTRLTFERSAFDMARSPASRTRSPSRVCSVHTKGQWVDPRGFEPLTFWLPARRSTG